MKRYLVTVRRLDCSSYSVDDRVTGIRYTDAQKRYAFKDYPGTLQELANDIEIEELRPYLRLYGKAYKLRINNVTRTPELFIELNAAGRHKKWYDKLLAGMPWGPKDPY